MANINNYELLNLLGSGTYSTVHKAIDKITRQIVAIKILDRKRILKGRKLSIDNLVQEIQLLKKLQHPYIVKMEDFCWDAQNIYIIMELCEVSLSSFIKKRQRLPETTCRIFIRMLAEAMKYLRDNNVSHFDLKPQNLLLTRSKSTSTYILKICDFGFAQQLTPEEENDTIKGSPLYMAPEIILKHKYDARADLWSIGVILYECLFGSAPYSSKSIEELMEKVKSLQKIEIPRNTKISIECEDLLTRLLKHDPNERITFDDFFNHDFVDLKHAPSDENMEKAIEIVTKAVEEDKNQNYTKAYHLYCEGLTYFVPLIDAESGTRKASLRARALSYLNRAEEIKHSILFANQQQTSSTPEVSKSQQPAIPSQSTVSVREALAPSQNFKTLLQKCYSHPQLRNGLEIGQSAEYYAYERKLESSLESYKRALGILVPLLNEEVDVERKKLLHKQILDWMKEAESIKSILQAQNNIKDGNDDITSQHHCILS
ncbi:CLUMA_CG005318, isoform A [Clunio marinus]|uniref:Serine/threonine-protein kinase ULK3 n=1 Tax=Clunio marinus TaxID=568069 RepID=A0A1J1HWD2_9DIPT|nr:CLUMA_CG005318, isoform A [Clunio marinus]